MQRKAIGEYMEENKTATYRMAARLAFRPIQAAGALRLQDPIVIPYGFSRCKMPAMAPQDTGPNRNTSLRRSCERPWK